MNPKLPFIGCPSADIPLQSDGRHRGTTARPGRRHPVPGAVPVPRSIPDDTPSALGGTATTGMGPSKRRTFSGAWAISTGIAPSDVACAAAEFAIGASGGASGMGRHMQVPPEPVTGRRPLR